MIWKKNIYDSLTGCASLCHEFAAECSNSAGTDNLYRIICLNLDCADICRNLAMLYVRGSDNTGLLAQACIEVCEKCAQEVSQLHSDRSEQIYALCKQTICHCITIMDMRVPLANAAENQAIAPALYGTDSRETLYN